MKVLNCGCINRVVLDTEVYISGDVYMESILVYYFHCILISLLGWAAMKFSAGTLTTQRVARLDTYMRECMYATVYVARMLNFLKIREDVRNVHASCVLMPFHCASLPPLSNYSVIVSHPVR